MNFHYFFSELKRWKDINILTHTHTNEQVYAYYYLCVNDQHCNHSHVTLWKYVIIVVEVLPIFTQSGILIRIYSTIHTIMNENQNS